MDGPNNVKGQNVKCETTFRNSITQNSFGKNYNWQKCVMYNLFRGTYNYSWYQVVVRYQNYEYIAFFTFYEAHQLQNLIKIPFK